MTTLQYNDSRIARWDLFKFLIRAIFEIQIVSGKMERRYDKL